MELAKGVLELDDDDTEKLSKHLLRHLGTPIPYQFLALQDCVNLSMFLIRTTMELMGFIADTRGVGGPVDVAVVTRTEGFQAVQQKRVSGDPSK